METAAITSMTTQGAANVTGAADALTGEDFFKLLIAQLSNQDPLEPTSNQELLQQISSIRDIELSTTLTESLKSLTHQQRYASAAGLIGNYVTGRADADDQTALRPEGVVVGVRFLPDGRALLQLDSGTELALEQIETVVAPDNAAASLVGKLVTGVDTSDAAQPRLIEGIVTGVRDQPDGTVLLELDTGEELELKNVLSAGSTDSSVGESAGGGPSQ